MPLLTDPETGRTVRCSHKAAAVLREQGYVDPSDTPELVPEKDAEKARGAGRRPPQGGRKPKDA